MLWLRLELENVKTMFIDKIFNRGPLLLKKKNCHLPPQPWTFQSGDHGFMYLIDGNGRKIASLLGAKEEKIEMAKYICEKD